MFVNGIIGHDQELARSILGTFIRYLRWIALFHVAATLLLHSRFELLFAAGSTIVFAGTFLFQRLLERGSVHLSSTLLLAVVFLAMIPRLLAHGIDSSTSFLALASVPLAALLFGMKVGIGYAALNFTALGSILLLQSTGHLRVDPRPDLASWALTSIVLAVVVVVYQSIAVDGQVSALNLANREREELDRIIAISETENRNLEAEVKARTEGLSEANQGTTRLSASLSHDLRAPLRSIGGFAKTLSEENLPDSVRIQLQGIVSDTRSLDLVLEKTMLNLERENNR